MFTRWPNTFRWVGTTALAVGILGSWAASRRQGCDFEYVYADAFALLRGDNLYDSQWQRAVFSTKVCGEIPQGVFYPPSTGFAGLPFGFLPFPLAQFLWFLMLTLAVGMGVRAIVKLAKPHAAPGTWELVAGLVFVSSCIRWGMTPLQGAPLVFGLLALFVVGIHANRWRLVFLVTAYVMAFKFTIALPFLGILLLHKRYSTIAGAALAFVGLNVLGFIRLGGLLALRDYRAGIAGLESVHLINTPDPWDRMSSPRLDWIYLLDGITKSETFSRLSTGILSALLALWLLREALTLKRPVTLELTVAFLVPLTFLSLLSVYHHHYDISVVMVPLLFLLLRDFARPHRARALASWLMIPLGLMMALLPVEITQRRLLSAFGEHGPGWMNIAFPAATTLALAGSLIALRNVIRNSTLAVEEMKP
jgi:hypothetical protein